MHRRNGLFFLGYRFILLVLILGMGGGLKTLQAQSFDHESYPKLDFSFNSLVLDLGMQPQNLMIDGAAQYHIEANVSGADTLVLYASHLDISAVSVDGESADFSLNNDSLYVPIADSSNVGQRFEVNIRYSGRPQFGLLKNANGTVWTSQLPKAQRHWVPIVDNPNVELQTTFNISLPSGLQLWATGQKTGEETVSVEVMRYQFTSQKAVPASSLAFAVGKFESQSTSYGIKTINLAIEQSLADTTDGQQLLRQAYDYLGAVEKYLGLEYPYDQLSIVVLEDHSWETKSWGASTIFMYKNRGNLETQLLRGIISQWFGIHQRESQWSQADAIMLYQMLIAHEISSKPALLKAEDDPADSISTIYDNFGVRRWNDWQRFGNHWPDSAVSSQISKFASELLRTQPSVISWDDYADFWYRKIGQPLFTRPEFSASGDSSSEQPSDSVAYKVFYSLNEVDGELKLRFESTHAAYTELTTLAAYEKYPNKTDTTEVTFTGAQDSVMLQVDPTIKTLRLSTSDYPELVLDEYKPASFLMDEFKNGETVDQRAKAARKLGYHNENPDLQLAIQDFMNEEVEPKVKAALLGSMADITNGAAGTEQLFLDALKSEHPEVRDAGLVALQNYKNSPAIQQRVRSVAENTDRLPLFKKATKVLTTIASPSEFETFVETITQRDSVGHRSMFAIQELANMGSVEAAVQRANLFTGNQYGYPVRSAALWLLIQHDHAPASWLSRAKELLQDADPRIRFLTVEGLRRNKNDEVISYLNEQILDEYDGRVYKKMEQVMSK